MRKPVGALLVAISVLLFAAAALSFVGYLPPSVVAVFQQFSAYVIGYLIGVLVVVVLLVYLGREALRAAGLSSLTKQPLARTMSCVPLPDKRQREKDRL